MNRRKFLQMMMAGGAVAAAELWVPGKKLISIPSGKVFTGHEIVFSDGTDTITVPGRPEGYTIAELYDAVSTMMDRNEMMPFANPMLPDTPNLFSLQHDWKIKDECYRHLRGGTVYESDTGNYWTDYMQIGERCLEPQGKALLATEYNG